MYLALREIWSARARFLLMGSVLALMALLIVIISGLSAGLVNDGVSALKKIDASHVVFEQGTKTDSAFTRSVVETSSAEKWRQVDGVEDATAMGLAIVNAKNSDGTPVDLTLFGIDPQDFLAPASDTVEGQPVPQLATASERRAALAAGRPSPTAHDVVVSQRLKDEGVALNDELTLDRLGTTLRVVGFTPDQRTFGHVDVAYLPLDVWQEIHAGARASEAARPEAYDVASVVMVRTADGQSTNLAPAVAGTTGDVRTMTEAFNSSPGYEAEAMTMSMIQWFLYAIAALVTGAFFMVWTIQRHGDIAVMRAMGASRGFLLGDSLGQATLVLATAIAIGTALALALASWLESTAMPFAVETVPVATGTLLLFLFGMIGATVAVLRVARIDPLTALGENR